MFLFYFTKVIVRSIVQKSCLQSSVMWVVVYLGGGGGHLGYVYLLLNTYCIIGNGKLKTDEGERVHFSFMLVFLGKQMDRGHVYSIFHAHVNQTHCAFHLTLAPHVTAPFPSSTRRHTGGTTLGNFRHLRTLLQPFTKFLHLFLFIYIFCVMYGIYVASL